MFYKSMPRKDQEVLIQWIDRGLCEWWHLFIVHTDEFLGLVYWKGREQQRPKYYYTRDETERSDDENNQIYPYTSADGYLVVFQRHFFVHCPKNARVLHLTSLSLRFLLLNHNKVLKSALYCA